MMDMEELDRPFRGSFFNRPFFSSIMRPLYSTEDIGWSPAMDVVEKEDRFLVTVELPGMHEKDIDVSVVGDTLTVRGERKEETAEENESYYCNERAYGAFARTMTLPSLVNADKIQASYEDGILEIHLPKTAEVQPKKIQVKAGK